MVKPLDIVMRDGKKVDALTDGALKRAEKRLGYELTVVQGSYNPGAVKASGGTHDKGGTVDLPPFDWRNKVIALRAVGFAAWHRAAVPGLWGEHVHAVLIGHPDLAPLAAQQVQLYFAKRDGLKSNLPDTDPGWTDKARFTPAMLRADLRRSRIDEQLAHKKARIAQLRAEVKDLKAEKAKLP